MNKIFVGGCQRSGTTMLASMLGGNNQVLVVPEAQFIASVYRYSKSKKSSIFDLFNMIKKDKYYLAFWGFTDFDELHIESKISEDTTYSELIEYIIEQYSKKVSKLNYSSWVTHDPKNIINSKDLLEIFPDAMFLHIIRDGRAVALSLKKVDFNVFNTYFSAEVWSKQVSEALAAQYILKDKGVFMNLKYENLIENAEQQMRQVCQFLGIEYDDKMIRGGSYISPKPNKNIHKLVGEKPMTDRINMWKHKLTKKEIAIFESSAGHLMELLGYNLVYGEYKLNLLEKVSILISEGFQRKIVHPIKKWKRRRK